MSTKPKFTCQRTTVKKFAPENLDHTHTKHTHTKTHTQGVRQKWTEQKDDEEEKTRTVKRSKKKMENKEIIKKMEWMKRRQKGIKEVEKEGKGRGRVRRRVRRKHGCYQINEIFVSFFSSSPHLSPSLASSFLLLLLRVENKRHCIIPTGGEREERRRERGIVMEG